MEFDDLKATWDGDNWLASVRVPTWAPFLRESSDRVQLTFLRDEEADEQQPPSPVQLATAAWFAQNEGALAGLVAAAMRAYYDESRPKYLDFLEDAASEMPADPTPEKFAELHGLHEVLVHATELAGLAYVGLNFGASWEREHGLGVLMHDRRIVDIGGADTSFIGWNADQDKRAREG
ncbi:MAG: hypothetical protein QM778_28070 [Myxococcales bacterium]